MFGIASASPKPELVVLMEKIGKVLVGRPEHIVLRGHTDGRQFRSEEYDNWRLSTARAQMAYYMLGRAHMAQIVPRIRAAGLVRTQPQRRAGVRPGRSAGSAA